MFSSKTRKAVEAASLLDFSQQARDPTAYVLGQLTSLGIGSELSALAFDPVQSLLAVGTEHGKITVFGQPSVQLSWEVGVRVKVKHLAWRAGSGFLCVVDAKDTLSVWDLGRLDKNNKPYRDSSLSMRSNITCIEASPSIPFLFLGGKDGTVDVFDLDRGVLAPHARIPNLWLAQEEILRRSGVPDAPSRRHIPVCYDVKCHPLDVNLVLVAYEGGVALWNIAEQRTERNFEFVIPPGAPGGGNDREDTIFAERRPAVTCLAWRPDGLLFAVGHEDGCISFACVSDDNPISIRTMERADVNKTTEEDLFGWTSQGNPGERQVAGREPIFRLAWSGYPEETYLGRAAAAWGTKGAPTSPTLSSPPPTSSGFPGAPLEPLRHPNGGTTLTILGGLLPSDPTGVHLLELPAYVPPTGTTTSISSSNIPFAVREALKASVTPLSHNLYPTASPPEDFLLMPRSSPFFGQAFDPTAILITTGNNPSHPVLPAAHASRGIEAWSFPPTTSAAPHPLRVPAALSWAGGGTCTSAELLNIPTLTYRRLLHQFDMDDELATRIPLHGGKAFPQARPTRAGLNIPLENEPRILVSLHVDLVVRFWDVSSSLLVPQKGNDRLSREYPRPLQHLDWDLKHVLGDPKASGLEASRILRERPWELELVKVSVAAETMELAVSLSTGDVLVGRLGYGEHRDPASIEFARIDAEAGLDSTVNDALRDLSIDPSAQFAPQSPPPPSSNPTSPTLSQGTNRLKSRRRSSVTQGGAQKSQLDPQDHHVDLSFILSGHPEQDGVRSVAGFIVPSTGSSQSCLALSDIGFLAASNDANLLIADMRGPDVLLVDLPGQGGEPVGKGKGKHKTDSSPITSIKWTISALGEDHDRNPRLIVVQASGSVRVFELAHVSGSWLLSSTVASFSHDSVAGAFSTFVLAPTGHELLPHPTALQNSLAHQYDTVEAKGALSALWITVTPTTLSAYFNIDGPRTAQYEGGIGFESATIVWRYGAPVLVVASRNRTITSFSLPDLVQITRMSFNEAIHTSAGAISFSSDGDLFQVIDPLNIRLHTTGDIGRPGLPKLEIWNPIIPAPSQGGILSGVAATLGSWWGGQHVYTAAEIEHVLGGPKRPAPKVRQRAIGAGPVVPAGASTPPGRPSRSVPSPRPTEYVQGALDSTQAIMASTTEALNRRGEYLGYLQERLGTMADDAAKFASDTKKTAQREAAKKSIAGGFSSLWNKVP